MSFKMEEIRSILGDAYTDEGDSHGYEALPSEVLPHKHPSEEGRESRCQSLEKLGKTGAHQHITAEQAEVANEEADEAAQCQQPPGGAARVNRPRPAQEYPAHRRVHKHRKGHTPQVHH